jgi:hypothetical protein
MILPWAHRLISAGAHGLRRIPGQSVNLAHPLFGAHHAPRPLYRCTPGGFPRGAMGVSGEKPLQSLRGQLPHEWGSGTSQLLPLAASPFTGKLCRRQ